MEFTVNIDTGGTYTDGFVASLERSEMVKVDTTPHDLTVCFLDCLKEAAARFDIDLPTFLSQTKLIRYSDTVGTNCLIQKNGPKLGAIVTQEFEGSLYAPSNEMRDNLAGLLSLDMVIGVKGEVDASGHEIQPLDDNEVKAALEYLIDSGARSLVVCLRHAKSNPVHEKQVKSIIYAEYPRHYLGSVPVFASSDVTSHHDDFVRVCSAIINAYIHRDMVRYLYKAEDSLRQFGYRTPLLVTHAMGGVARVAKSTALSTLGSGPTAGLLGCASIASSLYGIKDFCSVDVGGTSIDIGVVLKENPVTTRESIVEGLPLGLPMVRVDSVGGGGGAFVRVGSGRIIVGPQSAGGLPGPVAYDLGGTVPTMTDADLVLGYLDPEYFLGGRRKVNLEKARAALQEQVAEKLKVTTEKAAWQVVQTAEETRAREIAKAIRQHGVDPEGLTLFAFGGGGGLRCCGYASHLGIEKIIVFSFNAVACAFGSSTLDIVHVYERPVSIDLRRLRDGDGNIIRGIVESLINNARRDFQTEGFDPDTVLYTLELVLRGANGLQTVMLAPLFSLTAGPNNATSYGDNMNITLKNLVTSGDAVEVVSLKAKVPIHHYQFTEQEMQKADPKNAQKGTRAVFWGKDFVSTDVYQWEQLRCGNQVHGPSIVESSNTTYVVRPGWKMSVDKYHNAILDTHKG